MGIIKNSLKMHIRGKVGAYSFYTATGDRQIARVAQNSSNYGESAARTEKQQLRRAKWANVINFYKIFRPVAKKAFENKKGAQTDYNKIVSLNINDAEAYLEKQMYAQGGCVLEAFQISEGSLMPITDYSFASEVKSTIYVPGFSRTATSTIGDFSSIALGANAFLQKGDQISALAFAQSVDAAGVPRVSMQVCEITLDPTSAVLMSSVDPAYLLSVSEDELYLTPPLDITGGAFILSRQTPSSLMVSTERVRMIDDGILNQFTTQAAIDAAIASYGVGADVFLEPGSPEQGGSSRPGQLVEISAIASPSVGGTITGTGMFATGTTTPLVATPASGYQFLRWADGNTNANRSVVVSGPKTYTAIFTRE